MGLLLIDIGRGTQDILLYRPGQPWENSIQLILPSPTSILADAVEEAARAGEDLVFTGETMGGGPLTKAVRRRIEGGGRIWATPRAAATFDDDPEEVRAMGVVIVGEEEARKLGSRRGVRKIRTADVDPVALEESLARWGLSFRVEAAAVAVQDHGRPPRGVSDRRYRFERYRERLAASRDLKDHAWSAEDLPEYLTRMQGARRCLEGRGPLLFMDTGFAALLGITADSQLGKGPSRLLLNVGNGHTLAGLLQDDELVGFFEHHTLRLDQESLAAWLDRLVDGSIDHEGVYGDGGHGAWLSEGGDFPGWDGIDVFAVAGPRRALASGLPRRPSFAAPHGQMMLAGSFGLYRAWEARRGSYGNG
jgi:uncharacterized protein (DUF1786 family)